MPIIDVIFYKIEASREDVGKVKELREGLKVGNNTKVNKIEKQKIPGLGEGLSIDFEFNTKYEPEIGNITLSGRVLYHEKKLKNAMETKKGNIVLKPNAFEQVQNTILGASTIQAISVAKDLKLPPPIQLPRIKLKPVEETE